VRQLSAKLNRRSMDDERHEFDSRPEVERQNSIQGRIGCHERSLEANRMREISTHARAGHLEMNEVGMRR
jgi:hypothetical protein